MKTTFGAGAWTRHALCFDREGIPHWHLAARSDGFAHPHWARVLGLIWPGWRPKGFKVYRRDLVNLWAWQFRKRDGWQWRHVASKAAAGWARA